MRYLDAFKNCFVVLAFLLVGSGGFTGTVLAASAPTHHMDSGAQHTNSVSSCNTQCHTAILSTKAEKVTRIDAEENEDFASEQSSTAVPGYFSNKRLAIQKQYASLVKPPPKIPLYIQFSSYRI